MGRTLREIVFAGFAAGLAIAALAADTLIYTPFQKDLNKLTGEKKELKAELDRIKEEQRQHQAYWAPRIQIVNAQGIAFNSISAEEVYASAYAIAAGRNGYAMITSQGTVCNVPEHEMSRIEALIPDVIRETDYDGDGVSERDDIKELLFASVPGRID
jgi:MoaA/NifB/PqqE/SkfB family radical SAM enzyme